jgi:beta-lactamase regulating signal transducer with metallopeptidase domain
VILLAGVYQYFQTNNLLWIVGAVVLSSVLIVIPAIMRVKRQQERDDASR